MNFFHKTSKRRILHKSCLRKLKESREGVNMTEGMVPPKRRPHWKRDIIPV